MIQTKPAPEKKLLPRANKTPSNRHYLYMRSFDALYEAHGARIYRFCYRLCGNASDAEDLTQEVFVAAWQSLPRFAGRSTEQTWLYRIALYRWRRICETLPPKTLALYERDAIMGGPTVARIALGTAIDSLPEDQREAFLLVKAEELSHKEASAVLRVPVGTVQSRVFAAIRRLRVLLTEDCPEKEPAHHG